ncbi:MAG: DUF4116 domain-containing protein [Desulfovibrio sp.]|nr:DUF4116 domain-containing protein [Desulfovibrio sp.]
MPEKLKTPEMCLDAVEQNGAALEFVPDDMRTAELLALAKR